MMLKPGDRVVCVWSEGCSELEVDREYVVRDVIAVVGPCGDYGVRVYGAEADYGLTGFPPAFKSRRFRKVLPTKHTRNLTEWLSQPTDKEEPKRPAKVRSKERS